MGAKFPLRHNNRSVTEKKNEKLLKNINNLRLKLEETLINPLLSKEPGGCKNPAYVIVTSKTRTRAYALIDFTNA
jgi:hypothetical protein